MLQKRPKKIAKKKKKRKQGILSMLSENQQCYIENKIMGERNGVRVREVALYPQMKEDLFEETTLSLG